MALFPIAIPKAHSLTGRITPALVYNAFRAVRRNRGAAGIDQVSINMFEANRAENLSALERALKDGSFEPLPLRRKFLDKGGGKWRPLGIPAVRDRVGQEVLRRRLHPIFEPLFHEASQGFRPGRNCHQALELAMKYHEQGYRVVLDADIVGCLDRSSYYTLAHGVVGKSCGCWSKTRMRKPFCRPRETWTTESSPRLTRCMIVCRDTLRIRMASGMAT
jgi:RNA-directed DNA polymerase